MSAAYEIFAEPSEQKIPPEVTPIRPGDPPPVSGRALSRAPSRHTAQMQALVQRLFFGSVPGKVRHVAVAPADPGASAAPLCLDLALTLASHHSCDVGLIDAQDGQPAIEEELGLPRIAHSDFWPLEKNLWLVPRGSWRKSDCGIRAFPDPERLREVAAEFDFSILCCTAASWTTAATAQACDGLVLVLAAQQTRRLVAAQFQQCLRSASVPLLGTVLTGRRFPVPEGLYRRL